MKKLFLLLLLSSPVIASGPIYQHQDTTIVSDPIKPQTNPGDPETPTIDPLITETPAKDNQDAQTQREFQNIYQELSKLKSSISTATVTSSIYLQTVSSTTWTVTSSASTSYVDTNLSKSITLASASSRVEIEVLGCFSYDGRGTSSRGIFSVKRGSTNLELTANEGFLQVSSPGATTYWVGPGGFGVVDSPATSGLVTYTVTIRTGNALNTVSFPCNTTGVQLSGTMILRELPI